ncbi:hypothetical protein WJX72_011101 [[Myrmecia] bisecta]|uniref:Uncharacterized protein n=1 Tax=[Myrmecia] bisecta TaxID=41462 RepID=A0AAW1R9I9_9CHLO
MADKFKVLFCGEEFQWGFRFTAQQLDQEQGVQVVTCPRAQVAQEIRDAHVAVPLACGRLDAAILDQAPNLQMILQYGVGVEGVDIPAATERGIWVSNIPSTGTGNALSCAEQAIYLMLALLRDAHGMAESIQQHRLGVPLGQTLFGKTVLIVGFGNIAMELVPRLKPFGCKLTAVRRSPWAGQSPHEADLEAKGTWLDLYPMAAAADLIVLTCAQNEQTRNMVNAAFLADCKPDVRIINVARGGLLDYDAVKAALEGGRIGGLGLDVQWQEPWHPDDYVSTHPRVVLTPHVAGVTDISYRNMAKIVAKEVLQIQAGKPPTVQLNTPSTPRNAL